MIPTIKFRKIAIFVNPLPKRALRYPVNETERQTANIVAIHLKLSGLNVMAASGKIPPAEAENNEENAAFHGLK